MYCVRRQGLEPWTFCLEGSCSCSTELTARSAGQRTRTPSDLIKSQVPVQSGAAGVGQEGIEPSCPSYPFNGL